MGYFGLDGSLVEFFLICVKVGNIFMFFGFVFCWMGIFEVFGLYCFCRISLLLVFWWDVFKVIVMGILFLFVVGMVLSFEVVDCMFVFVFFVVVFLSIGIVCIWI